MQIELKNDEKKVKTIIDYYILTNKLKDLVRTGWKRWGVKRERVESVAEHIYGTCMLAVAIWSETLPEVNISEVILMLALHETEENIISDITPYDSEEKQKLKQSGEKAVKAIFKNLVAKNVYFKLVHDFDTLATPEAIFARKCDKLESDLQARLYSDEGVLLYENADEIKKCTDELWVHFQKFIVLLFLLLLVNQYHLYKQTYHLFLMFLMNYKM